MKCIDVNEIEFDDYVNIIDIRSEMEIEEYEIDGTTKIEMFELVTNHEKYLDKGVTYYIMCRSGARSAGVINELARFEYDLVNVENGIVGYNR